MKQISILAIGNSFSTDATRYLHQMAAYAGIDTLVVNLYIGGCSLQTHWQNVEHDAKLYLYEKNGSSDGHYVSIKTALQQEQWDFVTLQQASPDSGRPETYHPYIENLCSYVREHAAESEIIIHQTWAYEQNSPQEGFKNYGRDQARMYEYICSTCKDIAESLKLRRIPSGDAVQLARTRPPFVYEDGGISLCRDGFHMHLTYGRFLVAAVWFEFLLNGDIQQNAYSPPTDPEAGGTTAAEAFDVIRQCVHQTVSGTSKRASFIIN